MEVVARLERWGDRAEGTSLGRLHNLLLGGLDRDGEPELGGVLEYLLAIDPLSKQ